MRSLQLIPASQALVDGVTDAFVDRISEDGEHERGMSAPGCLAHVVEDEDSDRLRPSCKPMSG